MKTFEGLGERFKGAGARFLALLIPSPQITVERNRARIQKIKEEIKECEFTAARYAGLLESIVRGPRLHSVSYPYLEEGCRSNSARLESLRRRLARLQ